MAFEVGSIMARLQLDESGYTRGILNAQSMNAVFGTSVTQFINNPLLGTIGIAKRAAVTVYQWSRELMNSAENIQRLGIQTGVSTDLLQAMRHEFDLAGRSSEQADMAFRAFTLRVQQAREQGGPLVEVLDRLGVSIDKSRSIDQILRDAVHALQQYKSTAEASAVAAQLFGEEAGPAMIETINAGGGFDQIIAKYEEFGLVLDQQMIAKLAEMNTRAGEVQKGLEGVRQSLTATFTSVATENIDASTEGISNMSKELRENLTPAAEGAGVAVQKLAELANAVVRVFNAAGGGLGDFAVWAGDPLYQEIIESRLQQQQRDYELRIRNRGIRRANELFGLDQPEVHAGR